MQGLWIEAAERLIFGQIEALVKGARYGGGGGGGYCVVVVIEEIAEIARCRHVCASDKRAGTGTGTGTGIRHSQERQ